MGSTNTFAEDSFKLLMDNIFRRPTGCTSAAGSACVYEHGEHV
jgi:hypothetical protein